MRHLTAELPEVAATAAHLDRLLHDVRLDRLSIGQPGSLKSVDPPLDRLTGSRVTGVGWRGRELAVATDGPAVVASLGTSGWVVTHAPGRRSGRKRHLPTFRLSCRGGMTVELVETMNRKDGWVRLDEGGPAGPCDPLGPAFGPAELAAALAGGHGSVRGAVASVVGEAWADEVLHAARLSPVTPPGALADDEATRLQEALVGTVRSATEALGAEPLNELRKASAALRRLDGHAGEPCPRCGHSLAAGGGATYCPACQTGGELLPDAGRSAFLR
jgi:formamidopyrimidine-DNA glycosylase